MGNATLISDPVIGQLIESDCFDPARWPSGFERGAILLRRIREIEALSEAQSGKFDYEAMGQDLQDEYDCLVLELDGLTEPAGAAATSVADYAKRRGIVL